MYFKTAERNEVFRILDKIQPRRILDFGCNAGYEAHRIQEYSGAEVYGYDFNEHALDRGRAEFPNLRFLDRLQYPKFDGMFDLIVMSHVLEHIPDPEQIITETLERLNDGGHLLIILPQERIRGDCNFDHVIFHSLKNRRYVNPHLHIIRHERVKSAVAPHGMVIKDLTYINWFPPIVTSKFRYLTAFSMIALCGPPDPS